MLGIVLRNLRCELTTGRTSYEYQATGFSEAGDTLEGSHCVGRGVFGSEIGHQTIVTRIDRALKRLANPSTSQILAIEISNIEPSAMVVDDYRSSFLLLCLGSMLRWRSFRDGRGIVRADGDVMSNA